MIIVLGAEPTNPLIKRRNLRPKLGREVPTAYRKVIRDGHRDDTRERDGKGPASIVAARPHCKRRRQTLGVRRARGSKVPHFAAVMTACGIDGTEPRYGR